jgi:hypothetical protein
MIIWLTEEEEAEEDRRRKNQDMGKRERLQLEKSSAE